MDIEKLLKRAPKRPEYEAIFQAFQLETIQGSGERFTVLIAASSETEFRVIQAIDYKTLQCMFGDSAASFQGFIDILHEDLEHYVASGKNLSDWQPSVTGVTKSKLHKTRSASGLEGVLFQAITSYASLNQGDIVTNAMNEILKTENADDRKTAQLVGNVKSLVEAKAKALSENFRKTAKLSNGSSVFVDYLGIQYNAGFSNFDVKQPKSSLNLAKAKLYDLESLKIDRKKAGTEQSCELLAYLPKQSTKETKKLLDELERSADDKELIVRHFSEFSQIADHIVSVEKAS